MCIYHSQRQDGITITQVNDFFTKRGQLVTTLLMELHLLLK